MSNKGKKKIWIVECGSPEGKFPRFFKTKEAADDFYDKHNYVGNPYARMIAEEDYAYMIGHCEFYEDDTWGR